ncbi:MAG: hypothetical protein DSM107014_05610 [Gomphosphaeria aponina SAG 52.96 = DSM 107014]|uniref:Uncharacterized protein n=1 Tax=Gomphosphaeria aponina SAG 52.96 = DSM 107014 TaxID=1521640 RepID=A0A941GQS1_9CHRO|nr:hypothetical protein [Gomphosphaeria aponina SAG 52.96 = DSM 107014]
MNTNKTNQNLRPVETQARLLISQNRQAQRNRQLSMLQRISEEIGLE